MNKILCVLLQVERANCMKLKDGDPRSFAPSPFPNLEFSPCSTRSKATWVISFHASPSQRSHHSRSQASQVATHYPLNDTLHQSTANPSPPLPKCNHQNDPVIGDLKKYVGNDHLDIHSSPMEVSKSGQMVRDLMRWMERVLTNMEKKWGRWGTFSRGDSTVWTFVYCFVCKVVLAADNLRRGNHGGVVVPSI